MRHMLENAGWSVVTASTGEAGLNKFEEIPDEIACVVIDLALPGMDGFMLRDQILEIKDVPVLFVTGFSELNSNKAIVLVKPFSPKELTSTIDGVIQDFTST